MILLTNIPFFGFVKSCDEFNLVRLRALTELDQLLEDAPIPFIMQHAAKISGVRKRVSSLNSLLKSIQKRIDNMDRMLSVGLAHGIYFYYLLITCSILSFRYHCQVLLHTGR